MTVSSVASLRPAPTMAVYGLACVFLYVLPAIIFLIPTALVSAELASGWSGGVFRWVTEGMSRRMGFVAAWHQYAMTIFYYPTLLSFVASTLAYVIHPAWASSGVWTAVVIISVYWLGTLLALPGRHWGHRQAGLQWRADRNPHPRCVARHPGHRLPRPGQPHRRAHDGGQPAAGVDGHREHRADRQQLRGLLGHGDERGSRQRAEGAEQGVPQGHVRGDDPGALHPDPAATGHQLVHPRRGAQPDGRGHASLRSGVRPLRASVPHTDRGSGDRVRLPRRVHDLAVRPVEESPAGRPGRWLSLPPWFQRTNPNGVQVNILAAQGVVTTVLALLFAFVPAVSDATGCS